MSWKTIQKSHFGGRGAKWVKIEGDLEVELNQRMDELSDYDFSNLKDHFSSAGFSWIRYSKPHGTENNKMAAFEIRWSGCKTACPQTLFFMKEEIAINLSKFGTTPFKLGLEGKGDGNVKAPKKAIPKKERAKDLVNIGDFNPNKNISKPVNSKPSSSKEVTKKTEEFSFDELCKELDLL